MRVPLKRNFRLPYPAPGMLTALTAFFVWGPVAALWTAYALGVVFYFLPRFSVWPARKTFLALAALAAAGRLVYASVASAGQFYLWAGNDFTRALLTLPSDGKIPTLLHAIPFLTESSLGYFLVYSWGRFWLNPLLAILLAAAFYFFLLALMRRNERFFEDGETELGLFAALLAGWPGFLIFLPLAFASVAALSLVRRFYFKEPYTTLGAPLLLAAGITLLWGDAATSLFGLDVLRI